MQSHLELWSWLTNHGSLRRLFAEKVGRYGLVQANRRIETNLKKRFAYKKFNHEFCKKKSAAAATRETY